jgi:hypothetical protein
MTRGKNTSLGQALEGVVGRLDRKSGGALTQLKVMKAWEAIAGAQVMKHTTGAHLRQGELVVYVDSPVWATELSALSEKYREAVQAEIGQTRVSGVRFAVSKKAADAAWTAAAEEAAETPSLEQSADPVPLTDAERAEVEASAASISDPELRETAIRATVADLEWKKGIAAAKRRQPPREGA